jgi:hypothetical protein
MLIEDRAIATDSGTLAASLPGLVESEEVTFSKGLKAVKIGPPFSISVAPSAPNGTTWFTVVISDASKEPKAAYIYRVKDEGQGEIHVPTEWAAKSGKREQLSALKPAWIRVIRSQLAEEPMTDGGNLCTETATGVLFEGEIQKSDK